jgi:hypothetical protein
MSGGSRRLRLYCDMPGSTLDDVLYAGHFRVRNVRCLVYYLVSTIETIGRVTGFSFSNPSDPSITHFEDVFKTQGPPQGTSPTFRRFEQSP